MDNIILKYIKDFNGEDIRKLYSDAGWVSYINDFNKFIESIRKSLMVVSAWDNDKLVGLIRIVGDGTTIIFIQDILILNSYRRKGIGSKLLKDVLDKYKDVRQKVLLTDEREETRGFYEANGFVSCDKGDIVAFVKFN